VGDPNPQPKAKGKKMKNDQDSSLRRHLIELLKGGSAHARFEEVIAGIPAKLRGQKPSGLPHSPWMLLEHMRIGQWDILEFSRDAKHKSPDFPAGYWPAEQAPPNEKAWDKSVAAFRSDLKAMVELVKDPSIDLFAKIAHGDGQTILRQAMMTADHNAYHLGQLVLVRKMLGAWTE